MKKSVTAILAAAGSSTRMGFDKLSYNLGEHTVLEQSLLAFDSCPQIDEIVLVAGKNAWEQAEKAAAICKKPVQLVPGGATRAESVKAGVCAAKGELIAIHDAARPFVSQAVIQDVLLEAEKYGAAAPAVPVKDTIKCATCGNGKVVPAQCEVAQTPDRNTLYAVQTPQCFYRDAYLQALETLPEEKARLVTDDCSLFELVDRPVRLVPGDYANLKITTKEDLLPYIKEKKQMRIGHGYDVHKLVEGRPLILGGVTIPYEKGLLGHSDADVLAHAISDALLGAVALGDIGKHFPDTDPAYAGADSLKLASAVAALVAEKGYKPENVDATILCQAPKLAPHILAMRENLARALGMNVEDVSVKATTEEHLGFTGAGEGIAVHAVALLTKM